MSGPYPRSWDVGAREDVDDIDGAICRIWNLLESDLEWDRIEEIANPLLDALVEVGYVEQWGHSDTGCFWGIALAGEERVQALGHDNADESN
jgi:hypothetical protein